MDVWVVSKLGSNSRSGLKSSQTLASHSLNHCSLFYYCSSIPYRHFIIVDQGVFSSVGNYLLFASMQNIIQCHEHWFLGVKFLCKHQLNIMCYIAVIFSTRTLLVACNSFVNSLDYFGVSMGPLLGNNSIHCNTLSNCRYHVLIKHPVHVPYPPKNCHYIKIIFIHMCHLGSFHCS